MPMRPVNRSTRTVAPVSRGPPNFSVSSKSAITSSIPGRERSNSSLMSLSSSSVPRSPISCRIARCCSLNFSRARSAFISSA